MLSCFLFSCAGDHRDLPVLTHSFPTRRSSDLLSALASGEPAQLAVMFSIDAYDLIEQDLIVPFEAIEGVSAERSEEHTSELQSLMRTSYAVFFLKNTNGKQSDDNRHTNITRKSLVI